MTQLGDRIARRESERFVDRERELEIVGGLLGEEGDARVLLLRGAAGRGKTALLREIARRGTERGLEVWWADGRDLAPTTEAMEDALGGATSAKDPLVVIDGYERMESAGPFLRRRLLPSLPERSLTVIASRRGFERAWHEGGWEHVTLEVSLGPLSDEAALRMLRGRGISSDAVAGEIVGWAGGSPLVLSLAADVARVDPGWDAARGLGQTQVLEPLIARLIERDLDGPHMRPLAVAALARETTEALLDDALPDVDPAVEYGWLASRDFAEPLGDGVTLERLVGDAVRAELHTRHAPLERELRRRIADHLYRQAREHKSALASIDLSHLVEDAAIRWGFSWEAAARYRIDDPQPSDATAIAELLERSRHAEVWAGSRRFFEWAPGLVAVVRDAEGALCGYSVAATTRTTEPICDDDPILGPRLADAREQGDEEAVVWRDVVDLTGDPASGVIGMLGMSAVLRSASGSPRLGYLPINPQLPGASQFAQAIGARHLAHLDVAIGGQRLECQVVDWGPGGTVGALRETVYRELGLPAPEQEALGAGDAPRRRRPLVEREDAFDAIERTLEEARDGHGSPLVIEGGPGLGKTALVFEARERAEAIGLTVLAARGEELERQLPFGMTVQLLGPVLERERQRPEPLQGAAADAARTLLGDASQPEEPESSGVRLLHGLHWLVANLAELGPLLIAVDDLQWADPGSRRFLSYLAPRLRDLPAALVVASRPTERDEHLDAIKASPGARAVTLDPLTAGGAAAMVAADDPDAGEAFREACGEASGGNPLLLRELLRVARMDEIPSTAEGAERIRSLGDVVLSRSTVARLGALGPAAIRLAEAAAILGPGTSLATAAELAELELATVTAAADSLVGAEILASVEPLEIAHPAIRDAIYESLPEGARRQSHLRAAQLLDRRGERPERVAAHLVRAPAGGDGGGRPIEVLRLAAERAQEHGSPSQAVELLARSLDWAPPPEERARILVDLARIELGAGSGAPIERLHDALEVVAEPLERATVLADLGEALYSRDDYRGAADAFRRGYKELDGLESRISPLEARLLAGYGTAARMVEPDPEIDGGVLDRLHGLVEAPPEQPTLGERMLLGYAAGAMAVSMGEPSDAVARLARVALADDPASLAGAGPVVEPLGVALIVSGERGAALDLLDAASARAHDDGVMVRYAVALAMRSWCLELEGRLRDAVADAAAATELGPVVGFANQAMLGARGVLVTAGLARDDIEGAVQAADIGEVEGAWEDLAFGAFFFERRARLRLALGRLDEAREDVDRCRGVGPAASVNPAHIPWRSTAALAAAQVGDVEQAREHAEEELALARKFGEPQAIGVSLRTAGAVEPGDEAIPLLRESAAALEAAGAPAELARSKVELGATLRRAGQRREARDELRSGIEMAQQCGAHGITRRAEDELEASGARLVRTPLSGVDALTPSELRIARRAAAGRSNKEIAEELFLSLRTVETHLTHTYRKLDITSRRELATALGADDDAT